MVKKSVNLLPAFFRTDRNDKFLSSTMDQFIKDPQLERLDGFIGSKLSKNYNPATDQYVTYSQPLRNRYQLEPGLIVKDLVGSISKAYGYDDLINQTAYHGADVSNLNKLFKPEIYSYDPQIDWDKLINFREYYWLQTGPTPIKITGTQRELVSTYNVTDTDAGNFFVFSPDGLTPDPLLTLYRGVTYVFNVKSSHKLYIRKNPGYGTSDLYNTDVVGNGTADGQVIITVSYTTPDILYYASDSDQVLGGQFVIKTIDENSSINVDREIVGKKQYKSGNGIEFINGLRVNFGGDVLPATYRNNDYIVEGVGDSISLIEFSLLETPEYTGTAVDPDFDVEAFDELPFDNSKNIPADPSYITINRASKDLNPWSRYNRWFHSSVIRATTDLLPIEHRAKRPIIEFKPDIQLYNFGHTAIRNVDLIDNYTTDVFSVVEGSSGYWVDNVLLEEGFRVIFNADTDPIVKGRVYEVQFDHINGDSKINLVEVTTPTQGICATVTKGESAGGTVWWFNNSQWVKGQSKTTLNQAPLFDIVDSNGYSYGTAPYTGDFRGTKLFGYAEGTVYDSVLRLNLKYRTTGVESSYVFANYFTTDIIRRVFPDLSVTIPVSKGYLKVNKDVANPAYQNVWVDGVDYQIPVIQFQEVYDATSSIEVTTFDNAGLISDIKVDTFVNDVKTSTSLTVLDNQLFVVFKTPLAVSTTGNRVKFNIYTDSVPNSTGVYETPINLTNNPLNGPVGELILSELYDHVQTMVDRDPEFTGTFPGASNLGNLPFTARYGSRIISNKNPLSFAQYFISNKSNNLIEAIAKANDDYGQFKLNLIKTISELDDQYSAPELLDIALGKINENKSVTFPYFLSDMVPSGTNKKTRTYVVSDSRNTSYSITSIFDINSLSNTAVLVYLNGEQQVYGKDYVFELYDASVTFKTSLSKNDIVTIQEYFDTNGSFICPTPTKLGLYPKFEPTIYLDTSYAYEAHNVIQGHDGSLLLAFNDYRDAVLLEYEKRIYNNLKTTYNPELLDINSIMPGVFRKEEHSYQQLYSLMTNLFLKWAGFYGINYEDNITYDVDNHKTYNFKSVTDYIFNKPLPGSWRAIYKYYFDTDRPNTHPWEMLGITVKPDWWDKQYGAAPYTAGNLTMWADLEAGRTALGVDAGINLLYARPGLSQIIPVDDSGNVIDPRSWAGIAQNDSIPNTDQKWEFGDGGPSETAWRRSSHWPFVLQIMLALTKPADYTSRMFDTSRLLLNKAGQYTYGSENTFLIPANLSLHSDVVNSVTTRAAGYSVYVIEIGKKKNSGYVAELKSELQNGNFNLFAKLGGFVSKDKLSVVIDAVQLGTQNPTPYLPNDDYTIHFNVSNPIKTVAISGIIAIKTANAFVIRGYDKTDLFFKINQPIHQYSDSALTVGGKSEEFVTWASGQLYLVGQIVYNLGAYYRVISDHKSADAFESKYYRALPALPAVAGTRVAKATKFEDQETIVPYGKEFATIQDVYDFMIGYGHWLEKQGFVFNDYSQDFEQTLDWDFTAKEFIYWTNQNWALNSVITLSPFANKLKFVFQDGVVDNVFDSFYEYNLLRADGLSFPSNNFSLTRDGTEFVINTKNTAEGLFYAKLNLVQKEHALIFNNKTIFGDVLYEIDTGYRQLRLKLKGFKTAEWNGDFFSPGFVYDNASIDSWVPYSDYLPSDLVEYVGKYYSAKKKITGTEKFDFTLWALLPDRPVASLLPNFEYKINQFEDFYSLDIDNFDLSQQKMAQHLIGYSPRPYLENIFDNPISQYKFYQGFIKEKGTKNTLTKLEKASVANLQGRVEFNEEWAFRIGYFGSYSSYNEIELPLREQDFVENTQEINFISTELAVSNNLTSYVLPSDLTISPDNYVSTQTFVTTPSTYIDNNLILPHAGYVRIEDVNFINTTTSSLIASEDTRVFNDGDTIWVGFEPAGQWNVYRYTRQQVYITGSSLGDRTQTIVFQTNKNHGFAVGDMIAVTRMDPSVDGIYVVKEIPVLNQFIVSKAVTSINITGSTGTLFKFNKVRASSIDDLADMPYLSDVKAGELFWVDDNGTGKWTVFKKIDNYDPVEFIAPKNQPGQFFGAVITKQESSSTIVVSATHYNDIAGGGYGRVYVYESIDGSVRAKTNYPLNSTIDEYRPSNDQASFGDRVFYDETDGLIFAAASNASYVKTDAVATNGVKFARGTNAGSTLTNVGLVKISSISKVGKAIEKTLAVLATPVTEVGSRFGSSIFVQRTDTNKRVLIGAPGKNSRTGAVYVFNLAVTSTGTTNIVAASQPSITPPPADNVKSFGYKTSGNLNADRIAISAPDASTGRVYVYTYDIVNGYTLVQTISSINPEFKSKIGKGEKLGSEVVMSEDGSYLFVAASLANDNVLKLGKVWVYKWTGTYFRFVQILNNPSTKSNLSFGHAISISQTNNVLSVTAQGSNFFFDIRFDNGETTFDGNSCNFGELRRDSGSAYIYNRYNEKFLLAQELFDSTVDSSSHYGESVVVNENKVYIGSPGSLTYGRSNGSIYTWSETDPALNSWEKFRVEPDLVDVSLIKKATTLDLVKGQVIDYLDIIDPLKGKIAGIADQEIRYKTPFDPAVYSLGTDNVVVDDASYWTTPQVGQLWWDLSTVKYVWYEQGENAYRKSTWGQLFPGATIDIYEWVETTYLPSQWASIADTNEGMTQGISGQPRFANDTVYSSTQKFDRATNQFTTLYYFWVRNKTVVPIAENRRIAASDVARLIENPKGYGLEYLAIISPNAVTLNNFRSNLIGERIYLNIAYDTIDNDINKHTEWVLVQEGNGNSPLPPSIERKMIDSLLGKDSQGNVVPDTALPTRQRYGVQVRPRQTMFVDRLSALRNIIDFTNGVLKSNLTRGLINFKNLNSKEEIPDVVLGEYDLVVETVEGRDILVTRNLVQAEVSCTVLNGRITEVNIVNPGWGYRVAPAITIVNLDSDAKIKSTIDENGSIVNLQIINPGSRFVSAPVLIVRPFSVVVQIDPDRNNKWSKYEWSDNTWTRIHTQKYDTTQYWTAIDWADTTFSVFKPFVATIDELYEIDTLTLIAGDYVKVKNPGDGKYIILRKTADGVNGTFDLNFDIIYSEQGTIQISDSVWNTVDSQLGFDNRVTFDQILYDQTAEIELQKIITAIKEDIFVGTLKSYWNKFFFKCIKYALTEQRFLDWAFKTSFIDVRNIAGVLDQRTTYRFQDPTWYEDYVKEIKPYHTQIRNYQVNYQIGDTQDTPYEPSYTYSTDFDLPAVYDRALSKFVTVGEDNPLMTEYPFKSWDDNKSHHIESITLVDSGFGYRTTPRVDIIAAPGDTGAGATARAYIAFGKVTEIELLTKGSGYTKNPTVVIVGGGNTTLTPASAYPNLANKKVRSNTIGIKFDRISTGTNITSPTASYSTTTDGTSYKIALPWYANSNKNSAEVFINGITVLETDFYIENSTAVFNGYHKKFSHLVLSEVPSKGKPLLINYAKNIDLYSAVGRIEEFYSPTAGMPGKQVEQLMEGVAYPGVTVKGLPFNYSAFWDTTGFGTGAWDDDGTGENDLDTIISGGSFTTTNGIFATARGLAVSDIILDGDKFVSTATNQAPEELVPGQISESVSISVFTRDEQGSPLIVTQSAVINQTTSTTAIDLRLQPVNTGSVMVSFNGKGLVYGRDFRVNFANKVVTVNTQTVTGPIGITIVGVGGIELIASRTVTTSAASVTIKNIGLYSDIGSVYVTANGETLTSTSTGLGYTLSTVSGTDLGGKLVVRGLPGSTIIQAWFFKPEYKAYSEVKEQIITVESTSNTFDLIQMPGKLGPFHAQAVVELDGNRLTPPDTTYYSVANSQVVFDIRSDQNDAPGIFNLSQLEVYVNGIKQVNGFDFTLNQSANQIVFNSGFLNDGDVLAITILLGADYTIQNGQIKLASAINPGQVLKVITYTNHDSSNIRSEVFLGNSTNLYKMERAIVNDNYVWVSINGKPLINRVDFSILLDNKTVEVSPEYVYNIGDKVVVTSFSDASLSKSVGFRIFKDLLGHTHYTRFSEQNTTVLTSDLSITDSVIYVDNADILPTPLPSKNIPGVIFIANERIEYFIKTGNELSQLRRTTLGTGASSDIIYPAGTAVIDQGNAQTMPSEDTVIKQIITATNTTTYLLSNIASSDEVEVFYAGKLLQKPTASGVVRYQHDNSIAYDSGEYGSDIELTPDFTIDGTNLILSFTPVVGARVVVLQHTDRIWYNPGVVDAADGASLVSATTAQAQFLLERQAGLPDKYQYGPI